MTKEEEVKQEYLDEGYDRFKDDEQYKKELEKGK